MAKKVVPAPEERPPLYDPTTHTDPTQVVYVELLCECGAIWRQRDPVSYVAPQVRGWHDVHTGDGHSPASKATTVAARERRREAAFVIAGRAGDYRPRDYPHIDITDTTIRPWPVLPAVEA